MIKHSFIPLTLCLIATQSYSLTASVASQPNIVIILADDMGYDHVSALNPRIGNLKTPEIDRLVNDGMNFTDAHSSSAVCTPTRYGLLTGKYCWRTELKSSVLWHYARPLIEPDTYTLPEFLKDHGYNTGMIGKWHLGMNWYDKNGKNVNQNLKFNESLAKRDSPNTIYKIKTIEYNIDFTKPTSGGPLDQGFDSWFGVDVPNFPPYTWIVDRTTNPLPTHVSPDEMYGPVGRMAPKWKLENILKELGDKSVEWISHKAKEEKPFFLYLALTSPHTPIAPSKSWQGKSGKGDYVDFTLETDYVVGQVREALEDAGVLNNTLLIFTTDNGTAPPADFDDLESKGIFLRESLRGWKRHVYEGGHRVPFIVHWPNAVKAGSECNDLAGLNDIYATVADLLGADLPKGVAEDSESILPLINNNTPKGYHDNRILINHSMSGQFAIRKGNWKLVEGTTIKGKDLQDELYNLKEDLKEENNLTLNHPEIVKQLKSELNKIRSNN